MGSRLFIALRRRLGGQRLSRRFLCAALASDVWPARILLLLLSRLGRNGAILGGLGFLEDILQVAPHHSFD